MKIYSPIENISIDALSVDPSGGDLVEGRLWLDTINDTLKVYDGTVKRVLVSENQQQIITNKDIDGSAAAASTQNRITLSADTKANLDLLGRKAGTMYYGTDTNTMYFDNGTVLVALGAGTIPPGTVMAYAGLSVPTGYLACDGAAESRTTYADLFTAISVLYGSGDGSTTFNKPDLRGEFIRGADDMGTAAGSRGIDGGRTISSTQADATAVNGLSTVSGGSHTHSVTGSATGGSHNHVINGHSGSLSDWLGGSALAGGILYNGNQGGATATQFDGGHTHTVSGTAISNGAHTHALSGDAETRPRNVAMMYIIKT